jgi:hypothetical protein
MPVRSKKRRSLSDDAPRLPDFTCPHIDSAIEKLEALRSDNAALRDCVEYWKETSMRLEDELLDLEEWKLNIKEFIKNA